MKAFLIKTPNKMDQTANVKKMILTEDEATHIRDLIEDLRSSLYKTDFNTEKYIDSHFTESQKEFLLKEVKVNSDINTLQKSLDKVLAEISDMESILIKVSFEPTVEFISWVKDFLSEKTNDYSGLIVTIKSDNSMLAGVLIEFKGKIKDSSVKKEILNILSESNV